MNTKPIRKAIVPLLAATLLLAGRTQLPATPYASGITNSGGTVSFILNESADNVKVIFDAGGAGNTNNLGALAKGTHSFSLGTHTSWQIHVTKSTAQVWTQISDDGSVANQFYAPRSIDVNRDPASPYFGRAYVLEHSGANGSGTTVSGRTVAKGIFALNSDLTDALGQGDTGLNGGLDALALFTQFNSRYDPWKISVGEDGYLYVADAQDPRAAVARVDGNLSNGELVLAGVGNTTEPSIHTVVYGMQARGSRAGNNLTVWGVDGGWQNYTACNTILRWNIGAGLLPHATAPTAVVQPGLPTAELETDLDIAPDGSLFVLMYRAVVDAGGVKVYSPSGTLLWSSLVGGGDVFLNCSSLKVSPDGTKLAIARRDQQVWMIGLTNGPSGRVPDLSTTNIVNTFTSTSASAGRAVTWDAAGNLYVANNSSELLRVFSPGGNRTTITKSDGTFQLVVPPTLVSVTAATPSADEQGPINGLFTLTRTGDTSVPLTVSYILSGTATSGNDYTALPGVVTFLPGASSTNLALIVNDDSTPELTETAILTLDGSPNYGIGTGNATVTILDNETPEISSGVVATNKLLESYAPSKVTCQVQRRGLLTAALTVNLVYPGPAVRGADFNGPLTVSLGANVATANFTLTPLNDQQYEGDELAGVSIAPGSGYTVGTPSTASIQIVDDEFPAGTVLFSDDFNTDSTARWLVNAADPSDCFADFAWDYSAVGIPVAPGTADSSTKGLRLRCGNTLLQIDGLSLSPVSGNFTGNYRLKFDMWINYNGPMPDGGPGSTQNFDAGVGTAGNTVVWRNGAGADGIWFTCTGDGADGVTGGDYNAYAGPNLLNDDTGFYAAGTGAANSGVRDAAHPYYARWGGQAAPAAQLALFPNQTGVANLGNAGMAWHTVVITKLADTVKWQIDGITICTVTNDPGTLAGNIFVGYQDLFAGSTVSDVPEMSFGLVDNLRVETYASAPPSITGISIVGGNVEISFMGPAEAAPGNFSLQEATAVIGSYGNVTATITGGAGNFKAVRTLGSSPRFYRIKRN